MNVPFFGNDIPLHRRIDDLNVAAADRADSLGGAGRRAAVAILGFRMAGVTLTDLGVGLFIAVLRPSTPVGTTE